MSQKSVKMVRQISGTRNGLDWPKPGEILKCNADEAADLIRNGYAADPKEPEAAVDDFGVETAALPEPEKPKGRRPINAPELTKGDADK